MPSTPERRRKKRAADKLGISVEEYEAQLAAQSEGETLEDEGEGETLSPRAGNPRKSSATKGRKPPKAGKSELLNKMSEHVGTMGAQALQLITLRTMGPNGMLSPQEAQGIVQPMGRMVTRRASKAVVLPNMPGDDAEDVAEIALTLVEYVLRLISQAVNAYVMRVASGQPGQRGQRQTTPAPTGDETPTTEDPTAAPAAAFVPSVDTNEPTSPNGHADESRIFDMALMGAPYSGEE